MQNAELNRTVHRLQKATKAAQKAFEGLSSTQLNWKPEPTRWSVGQCLDHLVNSNETYFPVFEAVADDAYRLPALGRIPVLPRMFGRMIIRSVTSEPKRKMKAPPVFRPAQGTVRSDIVGAFVRNNERLVALMRRLDGRPIDRIVIASPAAGLITYTVEGVVEMLANHEERHLLQARKVWA